MFFMTLSTVSIRVVLTADNLLGILTEWLSSRVSLMYKFSISSRNNLNCSRS